MFKLESFNDWYPQQKVYLHLDKETYSVDEKVWFKAYLVNGHNHKPDSSSTNLYIELINPFGYIVQTKLIRMENGYGHGDFSFRDTVPDGIYKIRAYTNYMQNYSEDFFFIKDIYVSNPFFTSYVTREGVKAVRKSHKENSKKQSRYDVSFLPEGGYLLSNVPNRVAFKAINDMGKGIEIKGILKDKNNKIILSFTDIHRGMGCFEFTPEQGNKYTAVINSDGMKEASFRLPELLDMGINLRVERMRETLKVTTITNITKGNFPPNTTYYLVGHTRGIPAFTAEVNLTDTSSHTVFIPINTMPSGILHLTLFNYKPAAVSERLVFINNQDHLRINLLTDKSITGNREKISLTLNVKDASGLPVESEFSLSVAETKTSSTSGNLLSYLLLNSDLRGLIEDPDYYFSEPSPERENHLDLLMLTQGWRRFSWNEVLLNEKTPLQFHKEKGIEITGRITREFFNIPLRNIRVTITIMDQFNDVFTTRTDMKGRYKITDLFYEDTVSVRIEARRETGRKNLVILVDGKEQELLKDMAYKTDQHLRKPGSMSKYIVKEVPEEEDPFKELNTRIDRIHSEPRDVIIVDEKMSSYQNVAQILQGRIPGVNVSGDKVIIRGVNTFFGSTDPLFLVDGVPVDGSFALSMNPVEIERIEVLKGPDAAIYGLRGANGVIAIYTKRGKYMIKGQLDFKMLGYATPSGFYSPKYTSIRKDPFEDDRRTLLWIPSLQTDSQGNAELQFFTSDISSKYVITVEGLSLSGEAGSTRRLIEVK